MAQMTRLLRTAKNLWFAAILAVACTPAAAAALPSEEGPRFVDEKVSTPEIAPSDDVADVVTDPAPTDDAHQDSIAAPAVADVANVDAMGERDGTSEASGPVAGEQSQQPTVIETTADIAASTTGQVTLTASFSVTPSGEATVTVHTSPRVTCAITVSDAGRVPGLDARQADTTGNVTWTWSVARGASGSWAARVECEHATTTVTSSGLERTGLERAGLKRNNAEREEGTSPREGNVPSENAHELEDRGRGLRK